MKASEFAELKNQLDLGRAHDVTTVITRGNEVAVVRKHAYPADGYRTPSGGVHPEESFLDGAVREAKEETGLDVHVEGYLLYVLVTFTHGDEAARWSTHVLLARPLSGELDPLDTREIADARWVEWDELLRKINPVLKGTGLGGLAYRAQLHERTHEILADRQRAEN
jgi:8-oxo-dGTP pyrophosphatase MutT (NUDIX family)